MDMSIVNPANKKVETQIGESTRRQESLLFYFILFKRVCPPLLFPPPPKIPHSPCYLKFSGVSSLSLSESAKHGGDCCVEAPRRGLQGDLWIVGAADFSFICWQVSDLAATTALLSVAWFQQLSRFYTCTCWGNHQLPLYPSCSRFSSCFNNKHVSLL